MWDGSGAGPEHPPHDVTLLPGVTIGAAVGAGAAVSQDVAPYEIVGGVPARHQKGRFTPRRADALHATAWWDWDHPARKAALPDMRALDIDAFIEKYCH